MDLQQLILEAWTNRELVKDEKYSNAIRAVIEEVDKGRLRTAAPVDGGWQVNEWVNKPSCCILEYSRWRLIHCLHLNFMIR